ncbi:hypothetical protein FRB95_007550 [Tulasnella sp. JGI-2019a]|nr:hypothetical protein FRB95_007550 [Tulasnella sp. JGI-2019a]
MYWSFSFNFPVVRNPFTWAAPAKSTLSEGNASSTDPSASSSSGPFQPYPTSPTAYTTPQSGSTENRRTLKRALPDPPSPPTRGRERKFGEKSKFFGAGKITSSGHHNPFYSSLTVKLGDVENDRPRGKRARPPSTFLHVVRPWDSVVPPKKTRQYNHLTHLQEVAAYLRTVDDHTRPPSHRPITTPSSSSHRNTNPVVRQDHSWDFIANPDEQLVKQNKQREPPVEIFSDEDGVDPVPKISNPSADPNLRHTSSSILSEFSSSITPSTPSAASPSPLLPSPAASTSGPETPHSDTSALPVQTELNEPTNHSPVIPTLEHLINLEGSAHTMAGMTWCVEQASLANGNNEMIVIYRADGELDTRIHQGSAVIQLLERVLNAWSLDMKTTPIPAPAVITAIPPPALEVTWDTTSNPNHPLSSVHELESHAGVPWGMLSPAASFSSLSESEFGSSIPDLIDPPQVPVLETEVATDGGVLPSFDDIGSTTDEVDRAPQKGAILGQPSPLTSTHQSVLGLAFLPSPSFTTASDPQNVRSINGDNVNSPVGTAEPKHTVNDADFAGPTTCFGVASAGSYSQVADSLPFPLIARFSRRVLFHCIRGYLVSSNLSFFSTIPQQPRARQQTGDGTPMEVMLEVAPIMVPTGNTEATHIAPLQADSGFVVPMVEDQFQPGNSMPTAIVFEEAGMEGVMVEVATNIDIEGNNALPIMLDDIPQAALHVDTPMNLYGAAGMDPVAPNVIMNVGHPSVTSVPLPNDVEGAEVSIEDDENMDSDYEEDEADRGVGFDFEDNGGMHGVEIGSMVTPQAAVQPTPTFDGSHTVAANSVIEIQPPIAPSITISNNATILSAQLPLDAVIPNHLTPISALTSAGNAMAGPSSIGLRSSTQWPMAFSSRPIPNAVDDEADDDDESSVGSVDDVPVALEDVAPVAVPTMIPFASQQEFELALDDLIAGSQAEVDIGAMAGTLDAANLDEDEEDD